MGVVLACVVNHLDRQDKGLVVSAQSPLLITGASGLEVDTVVLCAGSFNVHIFEDEFPIQT